eukprot:gene5399-15546_t
MTEQGKAININRCATNVSRHEVEQLTKGTVLGCSQDLQAWDTAYLAKKAASLCEANVVEIFDYMLRGHHGNFFALLYADGYAGHLILYSPFFLCEEFCSFKTQTAIESTDDFTERNEGLGDYRAN